MQNDFYRFLNEDNSTAEVQDVLPSYETSHMNLMPYLWTVVIDFAIFFAIYKFKPYAVYLHALLGLFVGVTTLITSLPILIDEGIPAEEDESYEQRHFIIGLVAVILILLQLLLGILSKALQLISWSHPYLIYFSNIIHKYLGYGLIILCKIQVFLILNLDEELTTTFWGLIAAEIALGGLWLACKVLFFKMEGDVVPKYSQEVQVVVDSVTALEKYEYSHLGVFANYVYDLSPLLHSHPNGYRIINSVKGMDLDRFIYGMYPAERFPAVPANSHSWKAFDLLGDPVAKIHIPGVYSGIQTDITAVELSSVVNISQKSSIFELQLKKRQGRFEFKGYSSLRQIGRFYALSADNRITRLYTSVAFLDPRNLLFIANELGKEGLVQMRSKSNNEGAIVPGSQRKLTQSDYISLLIKQYPNGHLTPLLTKGAVRSLTLSEPRGEGLHLHELTPGKVIIVAGGTGLYPFSDLIDLLFKDQLRRTDPSKEALIYQLSPLLKQNPFEHFSFHLMLAVQQIEDIHPITLMQLIQLSKNPSKFKLTLRSGPGSQSFHESHPNITFINGRFDTVVIKEMQLEPFRKVWVCGPPAMTTAIVSQFDHHKIPESQYLLV